MCNSQTSLESLCVYLRMVFSTKLSQILSYIFHANTACSTGFHKSTWGLEWLASTLYKRDARERDDGNERRAWAGSDGKEIPSSPLSLIIKSHFLQWLRATGDEADANRLMFITAGGNSHPPPWQPFSGDIFAWTRLLASNWGERTCSSTLRCNRSWVKFWPCCSSFAWVCLFPFCIIPPFNSFSFSTCFP